MEHLQAYNKKLLSNILPVHVADFFMSGDKNNDVRLARAAAVCPNCPNCTSVTTKTGI